MIYLQILNIWSRTYDRSHICYYCCHSVVLSQALYLLLQCNYNVDEALRRHELQVIPPTGDSQHHLVYCAGEATVFSSNATMESSDSTLVPRSNCNHYDIQKSKVTQGDHTSRSSGMKCTMLSIYHISYGIWTLALYRAFVAAGAACN